MDVIVNGRQEACDLEANFVALREIARRAESRPVLRDE